MIFLYGSVGRGSFARVTEGMRMALEETGLFSGFAESRLAPGWDTQKRNQAPVALLCGDPGYVDVMHHFGDHDRRYLLLAPNSNGIAPHVKDFLCDEVCGRPRIDGFLAPSRWAADVLRREFPDHRVVEAPHGCSPTFSRRPSWHPFRGFALDEYRKGRFYVMHLTSTATSRKGTEELVDAWRQLSWRSDKEKLFILCHPQDISRYQRMVADLTNVFISPTMGMSDDELYENYCAMHVVCQPSRAEGFGMVPLEARCSGVPVVMTLCTGHSEHGDSSWVAHAREHAGVVPSHEDGPVEDYDGALAPTVKASDIQEELQAAREKYEALHSWSIEEAPGLYSRWTWKVKNEAALREISKGAEC